MGSDVVGMTSVAGANLLQLFASCPLSNKLPVNCKRAPPIPTALERPIYSCLFRQQLRIEPLSGVKGAFSNSLQLLPM
jgi:hypothetical protein